MDHRALINRLQAQLEERESQLQALAEQAQLIAKNHNNLLEVHGTVNAMLTMLLARLPQPEPSQPHVIVTAAEIEAAKAWLVQVHPDGDAGDKRAYLVRTEVEGELAAAQAREAEFLERQKVRQSLQLEPEKPATESRIILPGGNA